MSHQVCFTLSRRKGQIFADLNQKQFCVDIEYERPPFEPKGDPWRQLGALATIVELTASLPEKLPMRDELRTLATRALEAAVADLGEDVTLHHHAARRSA